uniref:PKD domain-containing protein n=2 Tax=Macrostomum lignano TaxID=282301 RepID=A0A1I8ITY0_9PLAT
GFVGVLGLHAAMFYWDQCFLTDFASATIEDAALAALFLLRDRFMSAQDYPQMKSVFLNGPREIYTADFIRAWCHLQDRGDPSLVPEMNRRKLEEPPPPDPEVGSPTPVPATPLQPIPLPGLWIDLVSLKLQLMKDGARQKLLASSFSEKHLTVEIRRRYGAVGINSHLLRQRGELKPIEDQTEFRTLQLPYDDKCDFPEVDVAQYDLESDMGALPYLLVQLRYEPPDSDPVILGWARVTPYERLSNGQFDAVKRFRITCPIYPGHLPDDPLGWQPGELPDFDEDDPEERQQAADYRDGLVNAYLGDFSEISLHGYPISEAPSPLVILPPPQEEPAKEKTPSPLPPPLETPPPAEEPEPVRQPKNIPRRHWTIHDPAIEKTYPQATATNQPFDVYIDQIRYMFDGITIVKLTGRFLNTGHDTEIPDILLVPNPKLSPRNLNFFAGQRVQITASDAMNLGKDSALVIRVYTLIKPDLEMVVVGTCVLPIFDNKGRLLTGGHQLRLREHASMVAAGQQRASLATSLDSIKQAKSLPCVTGLFRLLPQSARPIDAPDYTSGYYRSEECRPTDAELRVFREHDRYESYPETFAPLVNYVQSQDTVKVAANDYNQVMAYVPTRMDPARCLPPNTAPRAMPQELHFHYRDLSGAFVRLEAAYGLPKPNSAASADLIFGVLMTIVGAKKLESLPSKALGIGFDTMAVFVQSGAGRFTRRAEQLNPRSDPANTLLVQFFRLPGVAHRDGKLFEGEQEVTELKKDHFVAWAVCPLLNEEYTYNGRHRVPVFSQSDLPLTTNRVRTIRSRGLAGALKVDGALATHVATSSALLSVVDGHLSYKEAPDNAKIHTSVYEHLPKTTAADYQPAIDSAQLEQSSFGQNCQEAIDNAISGTKRNQYQPLFVPA